MIAKSAKLLALLCTLAISAFAQEAVMEEVRVEASFISQLEQHQEDAIKLMTERLIQIAETNRAAELQIANRTPFATLLDLTKYSPIPLGSSDPRTDTFALQSYMRADLNPPNEKNIFDTK
jgi:hypothetical protein